MSTTELLPTDQPQGRTWVRRASAATGAIFVILTFAGNTLTESVIEPDSETSPVKALEDFAVKAASGTAQAGLVLELLGFVSLTVFIGVFLETLRRRHALGLSGLVAAFAAAMMLSVKLASAAPYLAGLGYHDVLTPDTALTLSLTNGTGFVLCWLPFAIFVAAAALALRHAGMLGRLGTVAGLVIGGLGILAALWGVVDLASAMPVPFLLGCLWTLAVSLKIVVVVQN